MRTQGGALKRWELEATSPALSRKVKGLGRVLVIAQSPTELEKGGIKEKGTGSATD